MPIFKESKNTMKNKARWMNDLKNSYYSRLYYVSVKKHRVVIEI
jgi:hypothetical protein